MTDKQSQKNGDVYWIPPHNYVGQSIDKDRRMKRHDKTGKDVRAATLLGSDMSKDDMDSVEAFHIGQMGALDKGKEHANQIRGNDLPSYHRGCDTRIRPGDPSERPEDPSSPPDKPASPTAARPASPPTRPSAP